MHTIRWILVIAWMILIFYLSSIPGIDIPTGPEYVSIIIHYLEYLVLTLLLCWAINAGIIQTVFPSALVSGFIVAVFYGVTDELHQLYVPGRVTDMLDILVDAAGAITAVILLIVVNTVVNRFRKSTLAE